MALELIHLVAEWFPDDDIVISGDSAYGGKSILSYLPANAHLISHVHPDGVLYEQAPPKQGGTKGPPRKKGKRLPKMKQWAEDANQPWTKLKFNQFGLHATLAVKTIRALYYTAGGDRLLTIVLVRDLEGKRPDQMFYCTKLEWTARQVLLRMLADGRSNVPLKTANSSWAWKTPPIAYPRRCNERHRWH